MFNILDPIDMQSTVFIKYRETKIMTYVQMSNLYRAYSLTKVELSYNSVIIE